MRTIFCFSFGDFVVLETPPIDALCVILNSDTFGLYSLRLTATSLPYMSRFFFLEDHLCLVDLNAFSI